MKRKHFIQQSGSLVAGTLMSNSILANLISHEVLQKKRIAVVGTGGRFLSMLGAACY